METTMRMLLWGGLGLVGCDSKGTESAPATDDTAVSDVDGDGFAAPEDCDDTDDAVHPGASEICDGLDNDCDGVTDGADAIDMVEFWADEDGDGFGAGTGGFACVRPDDTAHNDLDCDDTRNDVNPDAVEVCDELDVDEDCNGTWDEACPPKDFDLGEADLIVDRATDEVSEMGLFGEDVAAGDVDADGVPELFISAPLESPTVYGGEGAVYMVPGTTRGRYGIEEVQTLVIRGSEFTGAFGWDVSVVPDLDGDGYGELAIGSTAYGGGAIDGGVKIFDGPLSGPTLDDSDADVALLLGVDDDGCGWAYDSGDLDGDGTLDHVVGCPRGSTLVGSVRAVIGPVSGTVVSSDGVLAGSGEYVTFGDPVTVLGDTDGDGTDDVAIVDHVENDNSVYVVAGTDLVAGTGEAASAVASGTFRVSGDNLRIGSLSGGDTDGDGYVDLFAGVGASYVPSYEIDTTTGAILGFVGPLTRDTDVEDVRLEDLHLEGWVAPLDASADATGDGLTDVLVGAPWDRAEAGVAYLFEGPVTSGTHSVDASRRNLVGEDAGDRAGWSLGFTPDLDADGFAEALISAPGFADYGKKKGTFDIGKGSVYLVTSAHL